MPTDEDLMRSVGQGNLNDFELIVRRHQKPAWSIAYRFLNDAKEAEDVVQESFLKILDAAPRYRPTASFKTYLYRVVANLCLDAKKKHQPVYLDSMPDPESSDPGTEDELMARERSRLVQEALASLPSQQRMAIVLRYFEELTYQEIAQIMQVSEKAVEGLLARGRGQMKKMLPE